MRGPARCTAQTLLESLTSACWQVWRVFRSLQGSFSSTFDFTVGQSVHEATLIAQAQHLFLPATQAEDSQVILKGPRCQVCFLQLLAYEYETLYSSHVFRYMQASRAAFRTLQDCEWLRDEVVNLYMQLLQVKI